MRKTQRCPKCQHPRLLMIPQVNDRSGSRDTDRPMYLVSTPERQGKLSAMMCRNCGYTEFYVEDPASVQPAGRRVIEVNGAESDPYR